MLYRLIRLIITSAILTLAFGCHSPADSTDSQGHSIRLADYRGKWVIINYWATWCKPCLQELPELNTLQKQYPEYVQVIGINFDGLPAAEIETFRQSLGLQFPLVSQLSLKKWGVETPSTLPMTVIMDPIGQRHTTLLGPQTANQLISIVKNSEK